jgi:hypothetical protein
VRSVPPIDREKAERLLKRLGFSPIEAEHLVALKVEYQRGGLSEWPEESESEPPR